MKAFHLGFVLISFSLFALRGYWNWRHATMLRHAWVRRVPHINDTLLLVSGVYMVWKSPFITWDSPWLLHKLAALLLYIGLGMYAFKWAPNRRMMILAWMVALLVFLYIVSIAVTKHPFPGL